MSKLSSGTVRLLTLMSHSEEFCTIPFWRVGGRLSGTLKFDEMELDFSEVLLALEQKDSNKNTKTQRKVHKTFSFTIQNNHTCRRWKTWETLLSLSPLNNI